MTVWQRGTLLQGNNDSKIGTLLQGNNGRE